jgi:hypothetical protein
VNAMARISVGIMFWFSSSLMAWHSGPSAPTLNAAEGKCEIQYEEDDEPIEGSGWPLWFPHLKGGGSNRWKYGDCTVCVFRDLQS